MQKKVIFSLFSFLKKHQNLSCLKFAQTGLFAIVCLTAALYMFAFSLYGKNIFGLVDDLIPFERAMLWIGSLFFAVKSAYTFHDCGKQYLGLMKK